jgi:hypothetical protein
MSLGDTRVHQVPNLLRRENNLRAAGLIRDASQSKRRLRQPSGTLSIGRFRFVAPSNASPGSLVVWYIVSMTLTPFANGKIEGTLYARREDGGADVDGVVLSRLAHDDAQDELANDRRGRPPLRVLHPHSVTARAHHAAFASHNLNRRPRRASTSSS